MKKLLLSIALILISISAYSFKPVKLTFNAWVILNQDYNPIQNGYSTSTAYVSDSILKVEINGVENTLKVEKVQEGLENINETIMICDGETKYISLNDKSLRINYLTERRIILLYNKE
jgi:hypothetical protein